jgi:hypothetical protein
MRQTTTSLRDTFGQQPWALWWTQGRRLTRIEVRRNLFSWKALWIYALAFIPTAIILVHALLDAHRLSAIDEDTNVLAGIIQLYYIRLGVFFGCLGIFTRLIRGEMMERSLHFYLLSPVRREILLLSKFVAGSIAALLLFVSAIVADFLLIYAPFGAAGRDYVFNGPGLGQLEAYLAIIVLACLGYGAVFLLLSMVFRNPIPGAMIVLGWEAINPRHLMPVEIGAQGLFALLTVKTEPVSAGMATLGLLVLIAAVLLFSCIRMRTLEIRYTTE